MINPIVSTVAMITLMVNETMTVTAQERLTNQSNSTNSDKQSIIVTWLQVNETKTWNDPVISIDSEDFWKIFGPLLEQSTKKDYNISIINDVPCHSSSTAA